MLLRSRRQRTASIRASWLSGLEISFMKKEHVSIFQDPKGGRELGCIISGTLKRRQKCARPPDVRPYLASIVSVHGSTGIMN